MFVKLSYQPPDIYSVNRAISFSEDINLDKFKAEVFEFAFEMTYGRGHHRKHRSGGYASRKNGELFINTFQGKLAEFGFFQRLLSAGITLAKPNTGIWGKGVWDNNDFEYSGRKISIKSAAFFSNLLLLEKQDWSETGRYIPTVEDGADYEYFIFCRIKPDAKKLMKENQLFYLYQVEKEILQEIILNRKWDMDIPGFISRSDLVKTIEEGNILPKNSLLNGAVKMDAENYYIQSGCMKKIELLISELKNLKI